jgi:hypothetical protein
MALSANTVLEVRLTGDDANGGGFVTGASGTDRSQQDAAHATLTTASVVHSTTTQISVNASDYTVTAADVGNLFQLTGGTATAGTYQITAADTVNNRWTLDRSVGAAGQTCPGKIGGALASPGKAAAIATVGGMITYIKYSASPYVITTASTNVSGGCPLGTSGTFFTGYDSVRDIYQLPANRPTIQLDTGVANANMFTGTNNTYSLQSLILDANGQTTSRCGFMSGEYWYVKATGATSTAHSNASAAIAQGSDASAILCEAVGNTSSYGIAVSFPSFCASHGSTLASGGSGFRNAVFAKNCLAYGNVGTNNDGFSLGRIHVGCVSYGNSRNGFNPGNNSLCELINSIAEANGAYGYSGGTGYIGLFNCADYNNTSGRKNAASGRMHDVNPVSGSGSFFTNAAGGDFTLNNTSGAGAALRAAGFPAAILGLNNYLDIGALQHQDAGGGGGGLLVNPGMRGGMI